MDNRGNSRANTLHAPKPDFLEGLCLLVAKPTQAPPGLVVIHSTIVAPIVASDSPKPAYTHIYPFTYLYASAKLPS